MWPSIVPVIDPGDVEAAVIDLYLSSVDLLDLISADNISTDLKGWDGHTQRWLKVSREGGPQRFPLDHPRIDVRVFAERRYVAQDIARLARAELFASPGYIGHGLRILAAQEEVGLLKGSGSDSEMDSYLFAIRLTTRAVSTES